MDYNHHYNSYACPSPACSLYNQFEQGNIKHRSWTGKDKQIERLYCQICKTEFSCRKGTLQEGAKISVGKQERMLKCLRWRVCDEGTADICEVDRKTVELFTKKASARTQTHHNNEAKGIETEAVQVDELYVKQAGSKTWLGAAIAVSSLMILTITLGMRNSGMAYRLISEIRARCKKVGLLLSDGWKPYIGAILI